MRGNKFVFIVLFALALSPVAATSLDLSDSPLIRAFQAYMAQPNAAPDGRVTSPMAVNSIGSITSFGTAYTENFDTLATTGTANAWSDNSTVGGMFAQFTAVTTNPTTYRASTGSDTAGAVYSFGVAGINLVTDRAFGSVASGTPGDIYYAFRMTNNTGSGIGSLTISYNGEQWRQGGCTPTPCTPAAQALNFQYQVASAGTITDANTPTTGWTSVGALDFTSPQPGTSTAAAIDGNAVANRTAISASFQFATPVPNGQEIWIRWKDANDPNNDHGLGIDDLTVTASPAPTITAVSPTSSSTAGGDTVTIIGTGFTGATSVKFGGTSATSVVVVNDTQITCVVPAHAAGAVSVDVTAANGTNVANTLFTYVDAQYRGGALTWTKDLVTPGNPVTFSVTGYFQRSGLGSPNVNDLVDVGSDFDYGDGSALEDVRLKVTTINSTEDWLVGTLVKPDGSPVVHTYPATTANYNAAWTGGNRLAAATAFSTNNWRSTAIVQMGSGSATRSPSSTALPVVYLSDNTTGSFTLPVTNFDSTTSTIAFGTEADFFRTTGNPSGVISPPGFTVNGVTRQISYDIRDSQQPGVAPGQLYYMPFVITSSNGLKTPVELMVNVGAPPPAPTVTSVSPTSGPSTGGTLVTINGTGFAAGVTDIKFGSVSSPSFGGGNGSTQIQAFSPAGSGTVHITVIGPGGASATSASDQFTYTPPSVTGTSPSDGQNNVPGNTSISVNFDQAMNVATLGVQPTSGVCDGNAHVQVSSDNFATCIGLTNAVLTNGGTTYTFTPASPLAAGGTYRIFVSVQAQSTAGVPMASQYVSATGFKVQPVVTSISPAAGSTAGNTSVVITGAGLSGTTSVKFGTTSASFTINSPTQVTATSPARPAGTVDVTVTTPSGTSPTTAADQFTYYVPPSVVATTPADGATGVSYNPSISITFSQAMNPATLPVQTNNGTCDGNGRIQLSSNFANGCVGLTTPVVTNGGTTFTFSPTTPLAGGTTYKIFVSVLAQDASGHPMDQQYLSSLGFTTIPPADYTITTGGGAIVVTDSASNSDNLAMFESVSGQLTFSAPGRTFSLNGGTPTTGTSPNVPLAGASGITVNMNAGDDSLVISSITSQLPALTVNGGTGNDNVQTSTPITFASDAVLDLDLQNDDPTPGTDNVNILSSLTFSGTGSALIKASGGVAAVNGGITTTNGSITIEANQQASSNTLGVTGVLIDNSTVQTTGSGQISINGRGSRGEFADVYGVEVRNNGIVTTNSATVTVTGRGGDGTLQAPNSGLDNIGVYLTTSGTIRAVNGDVTVNGTGGTTNESTVFGILLDGAGTIETTGSGQLNLNGTGGTVVGGNSVPVTTAGVDLTADNNGIGGIIRSTSTLANAGSIVISAISTDGGAGSSQGFRMDRPASISSVNGNVSITGTGGPCGNACLGISVRGDLRATGAGSITLNGTGANSTGAFPTHGVNVRSTGLVEAATGNISITGTGGNGADNAGVNIASSGTGSVRTTSTGTIAFITDRYRSATTTSANVSANTTGGNSGSVTFQPKSNNYVTDLGSTVDGNNNLELSDGELDRVFAGTLNFNSGAIAVTNSITRGAATNMFLTSTGGTSFSTGMLATAGGNVTMSPNGPLTVPHAGTDLLLGTGVAKIAAGKTFLVAINGTTPDTQYDQLNVSGSGVDVTGAVLSFQVGAYAPVGGEVFKIVDNGSGSPVTGTFNNLAQGATITNFLNSGRSATISYTGGDGNDITITVSAASTVQFAAANYFEDESQTANIGIVRSGDTSGAADVIFDTISGGTAVGATSCSGSADFVIVTGQSVHFNAGVATANATVQLCADSSIDPAETVKLQLSAPSGAVLGGLTQGTLTINDTASQYRNANLISINDGANATPYPSSIVVSNAPNITSGVRVTLYDVDVFNANDLEVLLVGPGNRAFVMLADAGGAVNNGPATLTLSDNAPAVIGTSGGFATGSYRPTSYTAVSTFQAPAVAGPYTQAAPFGSGTFQSVYNSTNPNGTWSLYIRHDAGAAFTGGGVVGTIGGGWGIQFFQPTAGPVSLRGRVPTAQGAGIRNVTVTVTGGALLEPLTTTTNAFGQYSIEGLTSGQSYVVTLNSRRFTFVPSSRVVTLSDSISDLDFFANP